MGSYLHESDASAVQDVAVSRKLRTCEGQRSRMRLRAREVERQLLGMTTPWDSSQHKAHLFYVGFGNEFDGDDKSGADTPT